MPRTKRPNKKSVKLANVDENALAKNNHKMKVYLEEMERTFEQQLFAMQDKFQEQILSLKRATEICLIKIPNAVGNKPIKIILAEASKLNDETDVDMTDRSLDATPDRPADKRETRKRSQSRDAAQDTGKVSRGRKADVPRAARSVSRGRPVEVPPLRVTRGRSLSRDNHMLPPSALPNRFRTPNVNLAPGGDRYNTITPKMQPNCPLSILRRPREGEIAFAMTGSPLLVNSGIGSEQMANINFPLTDGRIMSILPQLGLRPHDMPPVDDSVRSQLERLRENLNSILD